MTILQSKGLDLDLSEQFENIQGFIYCDVRLRNLIKISGVVKSFFYSKDNSISSIVMAVPMATAMMYSVEFIGLNETCPSTVIGQITYDAAFIDFEALLKSVEVFDNNPNTNVCKLRIDVTAFRMTT